MQSEGTTHATLCSCFLAEESDGAVYLLNSHDDTAKDLDNGRGETGLFRSFVCVLLSEEV
jgi:hypothetical protein